MKKTFILIFVFSSLGLFAQQQPLFDHYMFNLQSVNPAAVGFEEVIEGSLIYRNQWMGLQNDKDQNINPNSILFSGSMPLHKISSGVGINLLYDKLAQENNIGVDVQYAYHMQFGVKHYISAGLGISLLNRSIDFANIFNLGESNPVYDSKESAMSFDFDLGLFYHRPGELFAGISSNNLLQSSSDIGPVTYANESAYFLIAGYQIPLTGTGTNRITLTPSVLLRMSSASASYDISAICTYRSQFWGGLTYRKDDALVVMGGLSLGYRA